MSTVPRQPRGPRIPDTATRSEPEDQLIDLVHPLVLVVDDAPTVRSYHREILADAGFEVHEADNGYQALEALIARPYDLVVIDVNMPVMDGYTCVQAIRRDAVNPAAPIIMISTEREQVDADLAYRAGVNLYLTKPVAPQRLATIAKLITAGVRPYARLEGRLR